MAYWYAKHQSYLLWLEFSKRSLVILASVLLGLSLLPLREEASPPVVWTVIFMLWHVFMNSEDLASAPYSSTLMNVTFLYWLLNIVTRNFRMPRYGRLLLDGSQKWYEVADHIATKVEVNQRMISASKNEKSIWSMNPGAKFETSVVGYLGILVALVKRQIGKGYSNSGRFSGRPSMSTFLDIIFSLVIETWTKRWWIIWERVCFEITQTVGTKIFLSLWGLILKISNWI